MALDAEREIHSKITREPGSRPSRLLRRLPAASGAAVPGVFVVLWSSAFIAGVIGVDAAPPLLLMFSRFAAAGLLLAAFARAVRAPWPRGRTLAHVAVSGLLVQAVQFGALYSALGMGLPAAVVALVQGLNPVVIAVLAARLLGERVNGRQWVGFGLGAAGVLLAVADRVAFSPGAWCCARSGCSD
ncbi:DMT family transporter [Actinomadura yumaensis]|uniref:DMT family transporter n=1 Tax=Actinomadura yumaensis TaxID=111807 RepID=UPI0036089B7A